MTKKTLIFDFDGTIADDMQLMIGKFNKVATDFGLPRIRDDEIEKFRGEGSTSIFSNLKISKLKLLLLTRQLQNDFHNSLSECKPFKEIPKTLLALKKKGHKLAIISSNTQENILKFLSQNNLEVFDFVHSGRNLFGKEHVILKAITQYHLDKGNCIYVGDEDRDIIAAKKAGISVIAVTWGFNNRKLLEKFQPTFIAETPTELLHLV
jgi:phosphoglycolate phosphatase